MRSGPDRPARRPALEADQVYHPGSGAAWKSGTRSPRRAAGPQRTTGLAWMLGMSCCRRGLKGTGRSRPAPRKEAAGLNGPCSMQAGPGPFYLLYGGRGVFAKSVQHFWEGMERSGGRLHETPGGFGSGSSGGRAGDEDERSPRPGFRPVLPARVPHDRMAYARKDAAPSEARVGDRRRLHPVRPADDDRRVLRRCHRSFSGRLVADSLASTRVHRVSCKGPGAPHDCTDSRTASDGRTPVP